MSKFINVTVSASLSTDFYIEVPDNYTKEQIEEYAKTQVALPHEYPKVIDSYLKAVAGIEIRGIDSMLKNWNVDEVEYIVDIENESDTDKNS